MLRFPTRASLAATVSAAALLAAAPVSAQQVYQFGGGGTLAASTDGQVLKALDVGTPPNPSYCGGTWQPAGTADSVCNQYGYIGSGLGFAALAADNATPANNTCSPGSARPWCSANGTASVANIEYYANKNGVPAGFDNVLSFSSSDSQLSPAQLAAWNGTNLPYTQSGVTLHTAQLSLAGPIEQIPAFGTPITVAYNFFGALNKNGGIKLTEAQVCSVFNGSIQYADDTHLTGNANDNTNYPNAYGTVTVQHKPLTVVYRGDSSGTTFLFTQHLAAVCGTLPAPANAVTFTATQTFAALFGAGGNPALPSFFTGATGSAGVEGAINGTAYTIGYLSPDYTKIAPRNALSSFPVVASVQNRHAGSAYLPPNATNTLAALSNATITDQTPAGVLTWSPAVPDPATGYPIVGFTNIFFPQCFASNDKAGALITFLSALQPGGGYGTQLSQGGFATVPGSIASFVSSNILNNNPNTNIDVQNANVCIANGGTTYAGR